MLAGEGNASPVISDSSNSHGDSETGDHNNHDKNLSILVADMPSNSRAINLIINDFEGDSHKSPMPQLHINLICNCVPPRKLQDFFIYTTKHHISNFLTYQCLLSTHTTFLTDISNIYEP